MIAGTAPGLDGSPAEIVIDCMNTATALSYQDVYGAALDLAALAANERDAPDWRDRAETLLMSLSVPQLVRHTQIAFEAMRRAGTEAYLKVGTSGTGGMGFNIPYTHGEERPSRLLLSKAALAGAQTMLLFLMARTPGPPRIVKEIKPTALIGWRDIGHGPIRRRGQPVALYDCPLEQAIPRARPDALAPEGAFGVATGERLEAVYIDTGENGLFSVGEFAAITALGQMRLVTPEEIARHLVSEIKGENTGRDVIAGLDASVTGGSYRGGFLRDAALARLRDLEGAHGESVAFEILGPPRLSKLLFEAFLLKQTHESVEAIVSRAPAALAEALEARVDADARTRQRIISIGLPILLSDGEHLLRGPVVKATEPHHGWVDLTADNMRAWQERLRAMRRTAGAEAEDASSRLDQCFTSFGETPPDRMFEIGDMVAWIFIHEDQGRRMKD
jgi:hypothetical protein